MSEHDAIGELAKLAADLYETGYICGIRDDRWFQAYALTMQRVAAGLPFSEDMVSKAFAELFPDTRQPITGESSHDGKNSGEG